MRGWTADNPKAALLARKQGAILDAARREFLEKGFGNTTMAGVAATAGVSVATLYRHARSKEELFEAVVALRHDPSELAAGLVQMAKLPLRDALAFFAHGVVGMMTSPPVLAMHRMVIAEAERFPHLGPVAYSAFVGHITEALIAFLAPAHGEQTAAGFAGPFLSRLLGDRMFRTLLGIGTGETAAERSAAIDALVDDLLPRLGAS